ncbi:hypothetical protein DBR06_SOUSAS3810117, partial [Sousa chinensis]
MQLLEVHTSGQGREDAGALLQEALLRCAVTFNSRPHSPARWWK